MKLRALPALAGFCVFAFVSTVKAGVFDDYVSGAVTSAGVAIGETVVPLETNDFGLTQRFKRAETDSGPHYRAGLTWGTLGESFLYIASRRSVQTSGPESVQSPFRQLITNLSYTFTLTESHQFEIVSRMILTDSGTTVMPLFDIDRIAIETADGDALYERTANGATLSTRTDRIILAAGSYRMIMTSSTVFTVPSTAYTLDESSEIDITIADLGPVPEPGSLALLAAGALLLPGRRSGRLAATR